MGSIHPFWNCGPGAVVWLPAAKHLYLHMGVHFVSLLLALARALPDSQLLALVCAKSKQLDSPVGFAFGCCTGSTKLSGRMVRKPEIQVAVCLL